MKRKREETQFIPMSVYRIYKWYDVDRSYLCEVKAQSGLRIQEIIMNIARGFQSGDRRRPTQYLVGNIWCKMVDLYYTETPLDWPQESEQLKMEV